MNIQLPDPKSLAGAVLSGLTVSEPGTPEKMTGTVIAKAAYDLVDLGGSARVMNRVSNPQRCAVVFKDDGFLVDEDGNPNPADDEIGGFNVTREADIALQKARADIVVERWGETGAEAKIEVDGVEWFSRASSATGYPDVTSNLFGWHSRTENGRKIELSTEFVPGSDNPKILVDPLPVEYVPEFNNVYRRSSGFSAIGAAQARSLPSLKTVTITKTKNGPIQTCKLALPNLAMKARLRAWCGDCPDKPERWCVKSVIALMPDTLIVDPVSHRAEILWRGLFDWNGPDGKPVAWRLAQVMEGTI